SEAVRDAHRDVRGDDDDESDTERAARRRAEREQDAADDERGPGGELSARDRTEPLQWMEPVEVRVEDVVDEVRRARDQAERDERERGSPEDRRTSEPPGGAGRGEHQDVLRPLQRPHRTDDRGRKRAASWNDVRNLNDRNALQLSHADLSNDSSQRPDEDARPHA